MKYLTYLLLLLPMSSWSQTKEVFGETYQCKKDITLIAREGSNNVYAYMDGKNFILFAEGNYVFLKDSPFRTTFDSYNRKSHRAPWPRIIYRHPSSTVITGRIEVREDEDKTFECNVRLNYR